MPSPDDQIIPNDFTRKWEMADAVIQAQDSRKLLHVNRSLLACHCTFFKELFFSETSESKKSVLIVGIDFEILVEILKIIHQVNRNFGISGHQLYSPKMLALLYEASQVFGIPLIRGLFFQQLPQIDPKEAFQLCVKLKLDNYKASFLSQMDFTEIEEFLEKGGEEATLSPSDVAVMVEKCKEKYCIDKKIQCKRCGSTNLTPLCEHPDWKHRRGNMSVSSFRCNNCKATRISVLKKYYSEPCE